MHELSIAMSILNIAAEEAERQGGGRVAAIHLRLGPLAGVVEQALRSAYELAAEGSGMSGCDLIVEAVPLVAFCKGCHAEQTLDSIQMLCCPVCGAATPDVVHGRELEVVALEIEA